MAIEIARGTRQDLLATISHELESRLKEAGIPARIYGREKHLYTLYHKLRQRDQRFRSILDIYAFRVVVDNVDNCYRALGRVHALYKPRPYQVRDYIAVPKSNGYQSIHTSMIGA